VSLRTTGEDAVADRSQHRLPVISGRNGKPKRECACYSSSLAAPLGGSSSQHENKSFPAIACGDVGYKAYDWRKTGKELWSVRHRVHAARPVVTQQKLVILNTGSRVPG